MNKIGIKAVSIGIITNFILVLIKIYTGISTNSLAIYCDAINNLGDTLACVIAVFGFLMLKKNSNELKSKKAQSLCTFVISLIIAVTGAYFVYNGMERVMYPLPISYANKYLYLILATIAIKMALGVVYYLFNKKANSPVLKALVMDSILDCGMTLFAVMSLVLVSRVKFAIDGIFAILMGVIVTIAAIKNIKEETSFLINN